MQRRWAGVAEWRVPFEGTGLERWAEGMGQLEQMGVKLELKREQTSVVGGEVSMVRCS